MNLQLIKRPLAVIALFLAIGGLVFGAVAFDRRPTGQEAVAQNFVNDLIKNKPKPAFDKMTPKLQSYGLNYWTDGQFKIIKDYKSKPKLTKNGSPKPKDAASPPPYLDSSLAMSYSYQFKLNDLIYNLEIVIIKTTAGWQVNEYNGDYKT